MLGIKCVARLSGSNETEYYPAEELGLKMATVRITNGSEKDFSSKD